MEFQVLQNLSGIDYVGIELLLKASVRSSKLVNASNTILLYQCEKQPGISFPILSSIRFANETKDLLSVNEFRISDNCFVCLTDIQSHDFQDYLSSFMKSDTRLINGYYYDLAPVQHMNLYELLKCYQEHQNQPKSLAA